MGLHSWDHVGPPTLCCPLLTEQLSLMGFSGHLPDVTVIRLKSFLLGHVQPCEEKGITAHLSLFTSQAPFPYNHPPAGV